MSEFGAIWCTSDVADGGRKYFDQAVLSAKSFKKHNPSAGTAIFRAEEHLRDDIFDVHLNVFESSTDRDWTEYYRTQRSPTKRVTNLKILCTSRTPFERTLHLDADTFIVDSLDEVFEELKNSDLLLTYSDWTKKDDRGRNIGCRGLTNTAAVNSGVFGFRKCATIDRVLGTEWIRIIEEKNMGEQAVLSLYVNRPDVYLKDVNWKMLDNVIYNATRRMWRSMHQFGLWDEAKILHYNKYEEFLKLHLGQITKDDLLKHPIVNSCDPAWLTHPPRPPRAKR